MIKIDILRARLAAPFSLFVLLALHFVPVSADAAPCVANIHAGTGRYAYAFSFAGGVHDGCTGIPSGDAFSCRVNTMGLNSSSNGLTAVWRSAALRSTDLTGGCIFMCTTGDCRVGNDGLPVELSQFGVE